MAFFAIALIVTVAVIVADQTSSDGGDLEEDSFRHVVRNYVRTMEGLELCLLVDVLGDNAIETIFAASAREHDTTISKERAVEIIKDECDS